MAGLLSGLSGLGLNNLENMDVFGEEEKENKEARAQEAPKVEEKDFIFEKTFECPVCDEHFPAKIMKTGRAKLLGQDWDLRPK